MSENAAKLVVRHLADKATFAAQRCEPCKRVRCRATRNLKTRAHIEVKLFGLLSVDQLHAALGERVAGDEGVIFLGDHIDNGVADGDNVENRFRQNFVPSCVGLRIVRDGCAVLIGVKLYGQAQDQRLARSLRPVLDPDGYERDIGDMVLTALLRALPQIMLPGIRAVLWRTLGLTALIFALLGVALWFGLRLLFAQIGWLQGEGFAGAALAVMLALICGWLLFRVVSVAIVGLYADRIVITVEAASYPDRHAMGRAVPVLEGARVAARSVRRAIGWNFAALPLYLLLVITGVGAPLLFLTLNAHLLGLDLAELIEGRHPHAPRFTALARWQLGFASALLFLLPIVNLLAPVLSVAMATHMFHRRKMIS